MKLTEILTMSPLQFCHLFLNGDARDSNYGELISMFDKVRDLSETPMPDAVGLLTVSGYLETICFFLRKSWEERSSKEERARYYCIWRKVEQYYIQKVGMVEYSREVVPQAIALFDHLNKVDVIQFFTMSDEGDSGSLFLLDTYRLYLLNNRKDILKEIQKACMPLVREDMTSKNIPEEVITKVMGDLQKKVDDPEFMGLFQIDVVSKSLPIELISKMLSMAGGKDEEELDKLFEGTSKDKKSNVH